MNKLKEYESIINAQKEHISRYESRLKDIIVAYKGIAKEKAALEQSLQALSDRNGVGTSISPETNRERSTAAESVSHAPVEGQIQKLMHNLATITAERNRIEEVLKHERNQLRQELAGKDAVIAEKEKLITSLENQCRPEVSIATAAASVDQLINDTKYEDQSLKIRELKKRLDDEQNLNEQLELQLGNLKTQFLLNIPDRIAGSKKRVDQLNAAASEHPSATGSNSVVSLKESLQDLQKEMVNLKKQYATAVTDEKQRVRLAEESSTRLREIHEERVANFESRIRELSEMIGKYDRLKEQDKQHILQLKDTIAKLLTKRAEQDSNLPCDNLDRESIEDGYVTRQRLSENRSTGLETVENTETKCDLNIASETGTDRANQDTQIELEKYKRRYEQTMLENQRLKKELLLNQECITQLKHKIDLQKQSTAQLESELQQKLTDQQMAFKNETTKHAEVLNALQASLERQIGHLQDSLQNQRERSLAVMDEKDEEIKTLRTSLEILSLSTASGRQQEPSSECANDALGDGNRWNAHADTSAMMISSFASLDEEHQHLLHYAQEIARKNVEISTLRTSKNSSEAILRKLLQEKMMIEERYKQQVSHMEREIDRLRRNNQLEGSNLEYLKNVVLSFLLTRDAESKKHMTNAIAAVLKFDDNEMQAVSNVKF